MLNSLSTFGERHRTYGLGGERPVWVEGREWTDVYGRKWKAARVEFFDKCGKPHSHGWEFQGDPYESVPPAVHVYVYSKD